MLLGMTMVHLRTHHLRSIYEFTRRAEREQQLRQEIYQQQIALTRYLGTPGELQQKVERMGIQVRLPGAPLVEEKSKVVKNETGKVNPMR